jgi:sarcosine oxidase subunit alpha
MRHPDLGVVDRGVTLRFVFDGTEYHGHPGDTLASALLANGVRRIGSSSRFGRPRGIMSAGSEEPTGVVQIEEPFPDPLRPATMVELVDGLVASSLSGRGRLATRPDPRRYDAVYAHCEELVIGGGPTGRAIARGSAAAGRGRVILVDEGIPGEPIEGVTVLTRTTAFGYYDDNYIVAVERRAGKPSAERIWRIRAKHVSLATGAHERLIAFAGNDRPGIMLAGAARTYLHRYGVVPGRRAVVFSSTASGFVCAEELASAGVEIVATADPRAGNFVTGTGAGPDGCLSTVEIDGDPVEADLLLVSGGWSPVLHLWSQAGGTLRYDEEHATFLPEDCRQAVTVFPAPLEPAFAIVPAADYSTHFVDLQRDVTVAEVRRATGAGLRSVEHVKRYTTAGTAHDQGKTSGLLTSAAVGDALGVDVGYLGMTTFRPPYTPVSFAALAGRDRGDLFDPVRVTPIHDWHVAHGARWENVGQWRRPWYYPRDGETQEQAVLRECHAARTGLAMMDASTLGKIEISGPDAGEFLDRVYTNLMSTLPVGSVRYGVMCHLDGMVFDDGTLARLAEDRFLATTTTGNAAAVLDWLEEWLQTEWPTLRVHCTAVTDQWATVALVGPGSRAALSSLAPDFAEFPFMTWRDLTVAGHAARVFRISFSGELAYEINVPAWHGRALWEAVHATGAVPYGTETMHVLRAEKGYPIVGQDTDGTVTPQDLGMSWVVSRKKRDFLGKRSFARPDTARADRKHLVGLLPSDPSLVLAEGVHLVDAPPLPPPPVPLLGHVTSSYRSAALGRPFALGLLRSGRDRIGTQVYAVLGPDRLVPVDVVGPVLYDPEGARRDG